MHITFVSQDFPPETGGIQGYAHELAKRFANQHEVTVIAPHQKGSALFDAGQPYSVVRYPIVNTSLFGLTTPASVPYISKRRGAGVAFHAQYATALGSITARRLGWIDRYYVAAHAREILHNNFGPLSRAARTKVLMDASGVFAVSRYTAGLVRRLGVPAEKVHVVPNGVDLEFFYPRDTESVRERLGLENKRVMLSAGRLVRRKGVDTVIAAFKGMAARYPDLVFVIVGEGPYRSKLEKLAGDLVSSQRIVFTGRVSRDSLAEYYSLADFFVMPSREERGGCVEGFGLVFLEANACGTPVIGSWSGGIPDAIEHGVSGLLVPPDDVRSLESAIVELLENNGKRLRLGKMGLERARRFTWEMCATRILAKMEIKRK
ncbi:MAG: glycosyltransferase family 4 protein [Deltaproteobacteria bacterium]|nr:glycosyltransferase family 4 protein [Deltaproteobacteria bacterium]